MDEAVQATPAGKPGTGTVPAGRPEGANNGDLVASWSSPDYNENWQEGSICSKDMAADTKPCAVVEIKAPAPAAPAGGGKTSALEASR